MRPFLRYYRARLKQDTEELSYRAYVTDALMAAVENTRRFAGGMKMSGHWSDDLKPKDPRTAEEIVAEIVERAGLRQKGG